VIESIMIFGLGFLAATLLALLIFPAVNRRAERLSRRRLEALFPLSIAEITAEKDHLRAEFAVLQRQFEQKAELALAAKHESQGELGRRAVRIHALETDLKTRDERIGALEADLAETRRRLAMTEEDLSGTRHSLDLTRDTLGAIEEAHRRTLDELGSTRTTLETTATQLAETRTSLESTRERLTKRDGDFADLLRRHNETLSDLDARRITISDLETRLSTQTTRGDEYERALSDARAALTAERGRLSDLAKGLVTEQERALSLEQRLRAAETERETHAAEAARLMAQIAEQPAVAAADPSDATRDTALLRRLDEVADAIMARGEPAPVETVREPARRSAKR
jgi:predicted  nucleic acid-binding Zn-ribbon protein